MFEECFSMIEVNGLLETVPSRQDAEEERALYHHITTAVLRALEMALLDRDDPPHSASRPIH